MKLYRLLITTPTRNIPKGVWADKMVIRDGHTSFYHIRTGEPDELVASYPSDKTILTNVQTKEEYDLTKGDYPDEASGKGRYLP